MRVIDSSALVKYFSREAGWDRVEKVLKEGTITVGLAVKEVGNALWKKAVAGDMGLEDARRIVEDLAEGGVVKIYDQGSLLSEALEVAYRHNITIYDALFIVLAEKLGLDLVTADTLQGKVARERGVNVVLL